MAFSSDMAKLVADQLSRFVTLNRHQLAGQVENLDFWLAQVRHALAVLDGYGVRFLKMEAAQQQFAAQHGATEFSTKADYIHGSKASPPRRIPDREIQKSRRELTEATTRFLDRCHRDGLIPESKLTALTHDLGIDAR